MLEFLKLYLTQNRMVQTRKNSFRNHPFVKRETLNARIRSIEKGIDRKIQWSYLQTGGGGKYSIENKGYIFLYDKEDKNTIISYRKEGSGGNCFRIVFDIDTYAISIDISYFSNCSNNKPLEKGSGTLVMLESILKIIFAHKDFKKYKKINITDNSSIDCISFIDKKPYSVRLMDMYYVCTGCTWYTTLAPMFLYNEIEDIQFLKERKNILEYSYETFFKKLSKSTQDALTVHIDIKGIDITKPGSAHEVLNKIRKERIHCIFFTLFLEEFIRAFDTSSLRGKDWCIALENGFIITPDKNPCMKDTGYVFPKEIMKVVTKKDYDELKKKLQKPAPSMVYTLEKVLTVE
jgi:hypothetical protein